MLEEEQQVHYLIMGVQIMEQVQILNGNLLGTTGTQQQVVQEEQVEK